MSPRLRTLALAGLSVASSCVGIQSARVDSHAGHAALFAALATFLILGAAVLVRAAFRRSAP